MVDKKHFISVSLGVYRGKDYSALLVAEFIGSARFYVAHIERSRVSELSSILENGGEAVSSTFLGVDAGSRCLSTMSSVLGEYEVGFITLTICTESFFLCGDVSKLVSQLQKFRLGVCSRPACCTAAFDKSGLNE